MNEPRFRPLFSIDLVSSPQQLGVVAAGYSRRISTITDGAFSGDRLSGKVLPNGGDWVITRPDGGMQMDVRALLQSESGGLIYMTYTGRFIPPGSSRADATRSDANPYFRSAIQFETADPELIWLNDLVAVGVGRKDPTSIHYDIFEML
jgi:hypothetical protein